ncbi:hypothetical protein RCC89_09455 [Cytophagaceae bacterium ABcell3]|nr:hypothetical protein RCC89_09455 [Cytophagaceae bacterium ABcell3]
METTFVEIEDRVRKHSIPEVNERIDNEIQASVRKYTNRSKREIDAKIQQLEKEWSIERALDFSASSLAMTGIALGIFKNKGWLALTGAVSGFLMMHSLQGWCPPVPVLRAMGFRTRKEIDWEKYALKVLKGDFDIIDPADNSDPDIRAYKALTAVQI